MSAVNTTIGQYRIEREIGRGGMGVVYLSHDTRLDRPVAIKALPDNLADDPDRLARFEREAKSLAQLNHPNIATIHSIEEADGRKYLVLEYVDGETLADRIERGALPIDETLEICAQIAGGLEAAHQAGVVHRDLKPANVKITTGGEVKVLDFGLAKAELHSAADPASPTVAATTPVEHSPTIPGAIMGTPPYMSPEQARGRPVDKRSDIWSFGTVVYECLTATAPFQGETATDCIGAILHKEVDLTRLPPQTPSMVRHVLRRCLERDKKERLRDIGDAKIELEHARRHLDEADASPVTAAPRRPVLPWVLAAVATLAALATGIALLRTDSAAPRRLVVEITPPEGLLVSYRSGPVALSPDARQLAFVATDNAGSNVLCVRDLESGQIEHVAEGRWIHSPFWSPDGESIAYFSDSRLMSIQLEGGKPEIVTETGIGSLPTGGAWADDGTILFGGSYRSALMRVDRKTRRAEVMLDPFPETASDWPMWPQLLPDGKHFLFYNQDDLTAQSGVYVASRSGSDIKPLLMFETNAAYVDPPGALVYWRGGSLYAHEFDVVSLELVGEPQRIATDVWWTTWPAHAAFSVSPTGRLAYLPARRSEESRLLWFDRESGTEIDLGVEGSLWQPRISHDGRRIALDMTTDRTAGDIAVLDLERGSELRLTHDQANESVPVWSADDSEIYFYRGPDLYKVRANGTAEATLVYSSSASKFPVDVTADGKTLLFCEVEEGGTDSFLWLLDLESGDARRWMDTPSDFARFSPDGRWIAHQTSGSGEPQIVVTSFPDAEKRFAISIGVHPIWRADGKELIFWSRDNLMTAEVDLETEPAPRIGTPTVLSRLPNVRFGDATPDLKRYLFVKVMQQEPGRAIRLVENWLP